MRCSGCGDVLLDNDYPVFDNHVGFICCECLDMADEATQKQQAQPQNDAQELASDHWSYVRGVLQAAGLFDDQIEDIEYHYISAFVHGYKHGVEDCG